SRCLRRADRYLDVEQIAATGHELDHLPLVVAKGRADLANALEEVILADMHARPDRLHQLLLAEHPAGIGREQPQHLEGLGSKLDRYAAGAAQFGTRWIELEIGKTKHVPLGSPAVDGTGNIQIRFVGEAKKASSQQKSRNGNVNCFINRSRRSTRPLGRFSAP